MATPNSSASMESSPRPSPNSGALESISAGVISSSCKTSMINCFISSSDGCMAIVLLGKIFLQMFGQVARRQNIAAGGSDKRLHLDVLVDFNFEIGRARWQPPPSRSLGKHCRRALYKDRSDVTQPAHCDVGRAPFESHRTVGRRPRSFGENNQIAAAAHRCNAVVDQPRSVIVIADIARRTNGRMRKGVAPQGAFDNAV